jgi:hypothetical protein
MNDPTTGKLPTEEWSSFGPHEHRFEAPDLYFCRFDGDISADEMRAQINALVGLREHNGRAIFWMADVRNMAGMNEAARRVAADASSPNVRAALAAFAIFGAKFSTQVVVSLLLRAARLINPSKTRPFVFAETEAEARAFLDEQRRKKITDSAQS